MSSESPGASPARSAFSSLPVLTLPPPGCSRAAEAAFAAELREVCHTVGFFYVAGIDAFVSPTTRRDALAAATRFFAMPQEKKDAMDYRNSPAFRGYVRLGAENTAGLPDLREQVEFGVEAETHPKATDAPPYARLRGPNQWPNEIDCPRFRENASRFSDEARALSTRLTRLLALSLDLPADAFDGVFGDAPNVQMKIARYPPRMTAGMERRRRTDANANERNDEAAAFGVGAHTDSGFLSLLLQDDVGGLQVMNGAGEWVDAPPVENTLVVNLGEMLQLATRGYYLATPHRVLLPDTHTSPEREYGTSTARVSASRTSGTRAGVRVRADGPAAVGAVDARGRADGGVCRRRGEGSKGEKEGEKEKPLAGGVRSQRAEEFGAEPPRGYGQTPP
jgi:isopenicillin N synthase-like dioxygenase